MMRQIPTRLDRQNISFLLFCLGGLATLFLIGNYPLQIEANKLQQTIPALQKAANRQTQLQSMLVVIDQEQFSQVNETKLPTINILPLAPDQTAQIMPDLETIARQSKIAVLNVVPQLNKSSDLHQLVIAATLQGEFSEVRTFLYKLLQLSYVTQINSVEFTNSGKSIEWNLTYSIKLS